MLSNRTSVGSAAVSHFMVRAIGGLRSNPLLFYVVPAWILLWVVPWGRLPSIQSGSILAFSTDMLRLAVGLVMFLLPGALLYFLVRSKDATLAEPCGILPIALTFSTLQIGVIGLLGRLLGLSFSVVAWLFFLAGLVELVLVIYQRPSALTSVRRLRELARSIFSNPPLMTALVLTTLMLFHDALYYLDDTTYSAYVMNWESSSHLGFQNLVYSANVIENPRYWLALFPMGQALLARLSGLPGILLFSNYLELFLMPVAVLSAFWLARTLGLSRRAAGLAALIQVTLYTWMIAGPLPVGMWFYQNLGEDKVTGVFIFAPTLLFFTVEYLERRTRGDLVLIVLSAFGLSLTHPIMLFYACALACGLAFFSVLTRRTGWQQLALLIAVCAASMLPYGVLRLSPALAATHMDFDGESARTGFMASAYLNLTGGLFYGLNPELLMLSTTWNGAEGNVPYAVFRLTPAIVAALAGLLSLARARRGPLYWYVFSAAFLVGFATLPATGWLLGLIVSARMVSRSAWFTPTGLGAVALLLAGVSTCRSMRGAAPAGRMLEHANGRLVLIGILACGVFASPIVAYVVLPRVPAYFGVLDHNKQLAIIGGFIDEHTSGHATVIATDYVDLLKLPGVSARARLISFREEVDYNPHSTFLSVNEIRERKRDSDAIRGLDPTVSEAERCGLIEKYDVKFVVVPRTSAAEYAAHVAACPRPIQTVLETRDLVLLEFK